MSKIIQKVLLNSIIIIYLFTLSCSQYTYWQPTLENKVTFDPSFTPAQKNLIQQGLFIWTRDTGGRVTFTEVNSDANIQIINGTEAEAQAQDNSKNSTLPENEHNPTIGLSLPEQGKLYIFLQRINNDKLLMQTAAHEGGHQIGMIHIPQYETALMNPISNPVVVQDLQLTHYDILQFCDYWGCKNENTLQSTK